MLNLLIASGLFVALVWVLSRAVLMITRAEGEYTAPSGHDDPISTFVKENYGSHAPEENIFSEDQLRKL